MKIIKIKIGKNIFKVKDCKGLSSIKGLMFDNMKKYDGAFIYGNSIWMPFVKKKLNLIFLDKDMKVLEQKIAVPISLNSSSWKIYKNKKAKFCLELGDIKIKVARCTRIKVL